MSARRKEPPSRPRTSREPKRPRDRIDFLTPGQRSTRMRSVPSKDTRPERAVQEALQRVGVGFEVHRRDLPGTPDIVLPTHHAVIQVRGCFWHAHTCRSGHPPRANAKYWRQHLDENRRRDARCDRALRRAGWRVWVLWTCRLSKGRLERRLGALAAGFSP